MKKCFQIYSVLTTLAMGSLCASNEEGLVAASKKMNQPAPVAAQTPAPLSKEMVPGLPCPDQWRVSADYLYFLPTIDDTYFVIDSSVSTTFPNGTRRDNELRFHSGYRVGAEYAFCGKDRELQAFYTHVKADNTKQESGQFLWATVGRPDVISDFENYNGYAKSKLQVFYQRLDTNLSQLALDAKGLYFYLQPGIEFASMRVDAFHHYQIKGGSTATVDQRSRSWGVGPQMGFELDYNLYHSPLSASMSHVLSLTGICSGSLLVGRSHTDNFESLNSSPLLKFKDMKSWRMIPAFHGRVMLNYLIRFNKSKVGGSVGIGYEFNSYIRGRMRAVFPDDVADGLSHNNYYNFDIQGLIVSAAIQF